MWPVLIRELRAESRRPSTYWLRTLGGGAVVLSCFLALSTTSPFAGSFIAGPSPTGNLSGVFGVNLFGAVNATLLLAIILLVPLLAADCISREVREGTLGLLLLTPLTAGGVVIAKVTTHAIRALTLYLTALPFIGISLLLGGIDWRDLLVVALVDLSLVALALASGLLASTWIRDRVGSALTAVALSILSALTFMSAHEFLVSSLMASSPLRAPPLLPLGVLAGSGENVDPFASLAQLFLFNSDISPLRVWTPSGSSWLTVSSCVPAAFHGRWFMRLGLLVFASAAGLSLTIRVAASKLQRAAKADPPPQWVLSLRRTFCEPRYWRALFRRKMTWSLNRNPIGWLQQYSWRARCVKWLLCSVVVIAESFIAAKASDFSLVQLVLSLVLLLVSAIIASSSFRHERENGAMELLLVTPLSAKQIIIGRLRGCWMQLLPATAILILSSLLLEYPWTEYAFALRGTGLTATHLFFFIGTAFVLPLIGLYFSMWRVPPVIAFLLTIFIGLFVPWLTAMASTYVLLSWLLIPRVMWSVPVEGWDWLIFFVLQCLLAGMAGLLLHRKLTVRKFYSDRSSYVRSEALEPSTEDRPKPDAGQLLLNSQER